MSLCLPARSLVTPASFSQQRPQTSDEFSNATLGPQWEWNHNPDDAHWSLTARPGYLRLQPMNAADLLSARNTLTQCMQDNSFEFTARVDLAAMKNGARTGLAMFEKSAGGLEIVQPEMIDDWCSFMVLTGSRAAPHTKHSSTPRKVEGDEARYSFSPDDGQSFDPRRPDSNPLQLVERIASVSVWLHHAAG